MNTVRQLQKSIQSRGSASTQALLSGLKLLLETDLRNNIGLIDSPLYWLLGARDSLVPEGLAQVLQTKFKQDNVNLCEKASHAPFISQRDDFIKQLISIADNLRVTS
jgi:pimeloyl-[acyl-carrier protein] methyl ester esterase